MSTRKLSGPTTRRKPWSRSRRAIPRAARPVSGAGASMRVSKAAAAVPPPSTRTSNQSRSPGPPASGSRDSPFDAFVRGVDGGGARALARHAVDVGGPTADDQVAPGQQLTRGVTDRQDVDDVSGTEPLRDVVGHAAGVAVHRFVHHDGSHHASFDLGLRRPDAPGDRPNAIVRAAAGTDQRRRSSCRGAGRGRGSRLGGESSTHLPSTAATASKRPADHDPHVRSHNESDSPPGGTAPSRHGPPVVQPWEPDARS